MILLTDPVEVFRLLEKHGEDTFDVTQSHFSVFRCDHEVAVLVFCPNGKQKGPRLYLFAQSGHLNEIERTLHDDLNAVEDDESFAETRAHALHQLRVKIESQTASHFLFDAH